MDFRDRPINTEGSHHIGIADAEIGGYSASYPLIKWVRPLDVPYVLDKLAEEKAAYLDLVCGGKNWSRQ